MAEWLQLKQQDALVAELKKVITRQEEEKAILEEEVGKSKIAIKELSTREYDAAQESDKMTEDIEGLVRKLADVESTSESTINLLREENSTLLVAAQEQGILFINMQMELANTRNLYENNNIELSNQLAENDQIKTSSSSLKQKSEELSVEVDILKASAALHESNISSKTKTIEELSLNVDNLTKEVANERSLKEEFKTKFENTLTESTSLSTERNNFLQKITTLQHENQEMVIAKDNSVQKLSDNEVRLVESEEALSRNEEKIEELQLKLKNSSEIIEKLELKNTSAEKSSKLLQEKIHLKEAELSKVNSVVGSAMQVQELKSNNLRSQKSITLLGKTNCIVAAKHYHLLLNYRLVNKHDRQCTRVEWNCRESKSILLMKKTSSTATSKYFRQWLAFCSDKKSSDTSEVLEEVTTILSSVTGMNDIVGACRVVGELRNELCDSSAVRKELQQEFMETTNKLQEAIMNLTNEVVFLTSSRTELVSSLWELHKLNLSIRNELSHSLSPESLTRAICSVSNATEKTSWLVSTYLSETEKSVLGTVSVVDTTPTTVDKNSGTPPPSRGMHRNETRTLLQRTDLRNTRSDTATVSRSIPPTTMNTMDVLG